METDLGAELKALGASLGNFLSGMETEPNVPVGQPSIHKPWKLP